jgi:hypothetical protein
MSAFLRLSALFLLSGCVTVQSSATEGPALFEPQVRQQAETDVLGPQSRHAKGELRVLIAAVRFPDVEPKLSLGALERKTSVELNAYVKDQSYGQAWIKPRFMGWVPLPNSISAYKVSPNNFKVDRRRVRKLIEDTMTALEKRGVDFPDYDHMLIIPGVVTLPGRGYGMMCYCGNPGMLTGVRRNPRFVTLRSRGKQSFSGGVFVETENAPLGMFAHDFFHALGGGVSEQTVGALTVQFRASG